VSSLPGDPEIRIVAEKTNQDLLALVKETSRDFELNPLLLTLIRELTSHHIPTRMAALRWIYMLLEKQAKVGFASCFLSMGGPLKKAQRTRPLRNRK
jgi:hypothetical protein